jgi:hypothetical protein
MGLGKHIWVGALGLALATSGQTLYAQDAKQIVQQAVNTELAANRDDQSHWRYLRHEGVGDVAVVVETEDGAISRHIEVDGRPAPAATIGGENAYIEKFIHDPGMRQRQRHDGEHDEKDATELLNLLPQAFDWKMESETPETYVLAFKPDPKFRPPDMEARVMGEMEGTLIVDKAQHRIVTMKGKLAEDVTIGWGILGRLKQGGTFNVERRQVAPGFWEITETHVHISGRALFFKTIGQQQDEVKTEFTAVPHGTTLEQAVEMLNQPAK